MKDSFSTYHPLVNFLYFALVLVFAMLFIHPVCLVISLVGAFSYSIYQGGRKAARFGYIFMLPMFIVTALINPAFNHEGATILTYLPGGNPLTLESIIYGAATALMLIAVVCWFSCFNAVITSDKFVYLFGRVIPALSLILSMSLRLVPRFKAQIKTIAGAQRCIGRDVSSGSIFQRARHGIRILSIMVTWALENAIETADSMKSRGYGLSGRTAFSIFRFARRDRSALLFLLAAGAYIAVGAVTGGLNFRYFPTARGTEISLYSVSLFAAHVALCLMPLILNIREDLNWKAIQSKI